jgi:hypothetical protein
LAQQYADLWCAQVKLYRVPFVHIGSAPWGEGQMHSSARLIQSRQLLTRGRPTQASFSRPERVSEWPRFFPQEVDRGNEIVALLGCPV